MMRRKIAGETNGGFLQQSLSSHHSLSATAVDVKPYNYALIYGIVALSMHEFLSV